MNLNRPMDNMLSTKSQKANKKNVHLSKCQKEPHQNKSISELK